MGKYTHSSVADVAALIAAVGADLVSEGWTVHATVVGAWTSPATPDGRQLSVYFYEEATYGYFAYQMFVDTLPSDDTTHIALGSYCVDFTASRNWTVYAYPEGVFILDDTATATYDDGICGFGMFEPFDETFQATLWNRGGMWAVRSRGPGSTTNYDWWPGRYDHSMGAMYAGVSTQFDQAGLVPYVSQGISNTGNNPPAGYITDSGVKAVVHRDVWIAMDTASSSWTAVGKWFFGNVLAIYPHATDKPSQGDTFTMDNGDVYEIPSHQSFAPTQDYREPFLALRTTEG